MSLTGHDDCARALFFALTRPEGHGRAYTAWMPQRSSSATARNVPLTTARVVAGALGVVQLAGVGYFTLMSPEDAVFLGPALDIPIVGTMVLGMLLKLVCALWPRLSVSRRITVGLMAVAIGVVTTLMKIPLYDEPEGVTFLVAEGVLLALLLRARRVARRSTPHEPAQLGMSV